MTLLSGHKEDTFFVTHHIIELKLYVKIAWYGDNLRYVTRTLFDHLNDNRHAFVVMHWTPSEIIDGDIEYEPISMPKCEQFTGERSKDTLCKYELMPILKYAKYLQKAPEVYTLFTNLYLERNNETNLLQMYNNMTDSQMTQLSEMSADKSQADKAKHRIYDEVACSYVRQNEQTLRNDIVDANSPTQMTTNSKRQIFIGGIYPKREEAENEHNGSC